MNDKLFLKEYRNKYNLTTKEISEKLGVPVSTLKTIEKGSKPNVVLAIKLAKFFNVSVEMLFHDPTSKNYSKLSYKYLIESLDDLVDLIAQLKDKDHEKETIEKSILRVCQVINMELVDKKELLSILDKNESLLKENSDLKTRIINTLEDLNNIKDDYYKKIAENKVLTSKALEG